MAQQIIGPLCEKCGIATTFLKVELVGAEPVNVFECECCEKLLAETTLPTDENLRAAIKAARRYAYRT